MKGMSQWQAFKVHCFNPRVGIARSHLRCTRRTLCSRTRRPPTHTRTAIRHVFSARICPGPQRVPTSGEEVFRMAGDCDTSMNPEARMFREIELRRKEAHHGVASRAVASWTQFQGSVGRRYNRHFGCALIACRLPKTNRTIVHFCRQLGTDHSTPSSKNETIWLRPVSIIMDGPEAFGRESSWRTRNLKLC
jgi:hypothetical protein